MSEIDAFELELFGNPEELPTPCPDCGSVEIHCGYGFAHGPLGGYEECLSCGKLIHFTPDPDGGTDQPCFVGSDKA